MLKKLSHIVLSTLLLLSTIGLAVSRHYCGEKLVEISLTGEVGSCCDMQSNCCHDESQTFQLDQDYPVPVVMNHVDYFVFVIFEIQTFLTDFQQTTNLTSNLFEVSESPPIKEVSQFLCDIQVFRL